MNDAKQIAHVRSLYLFQQKRIIVISVITTIFFLHWGSLCFDADMSSINFEILLLYKDLSVRLQRFVILCCEK